MTNSTSTAIMEHPTLDGRPVLIGDRLIAHCEWDEGPAVDMEFVVIGIVPDIDDYRLTGRMSWTPLAERSSCSVATRAAGHPIAAAKRYR